MCVNMTWGMDRGGMTKGWVGSVGGDEPESLFRETMNEDADGAEEVENEDNDERERGRERGSDNEGDMGSSLEGGRNMVVGTSLGVVILAKQWLVLWLIAVL